MASPLWLSLFCSHQPQGQLECISKVWEAALSQSPLCVSDPGPRASDPLLPFLGPEPMCLVGHLCLACWMIFNNVNI